MVASGRSVRKSYHVPTPQQWQAVEGRDSRFDDRFVFAVQSTRIYCRPSCPSRRPALKQVRIYRRSQHAEEAGFRACKRCHPNRPKEPTPQAQLVRRICASIDARNEGTARLRDLSVELGMSPYHLQRVFKQHMGISPRQYAMARRLDQFKTHVRNGFTVTGALYEAGYGSGSRLYEAANRQLGMTPKTYQRGGKGMHINYTITDSPLGRLLVAATSQGVCFLCLGDKDRPLQQALRAEYPAAELQSNAAPLKESVRQVLQHLCGNTQDFHIPLDVQATSFQRKVWKKLQEIPSGKTRSYSDIARSLGNPRANRAVARACATNRVSIIIPCHRVIREDGGLGGYRWGLKRKEALLEIETQTRQ